MVLTENFKNDQLISSGLGEWHRSPFSEKHDVDLDFPTLRTSWFVTTSIHWIQFSLCSIADNEIRIWRLYPFALESLAPLMSFHCAHLPVHMTILHDNLAVAFQDPLSATYSVTLYNMEIQGSSVVYFTPELQLWSAWSNKCWLAILWFSDRYDHSPESDHIGSITGLSACPTLRFIASCSADNTVRIWDEKNQLIRVIKLNAVPHSLSFCSEKGDLLVGIGSHLHVIDHQNCKNLSWPLCRLHIFASAFTFPGNQHEVLLLKSANELELSESTLSSTSQQVLVANKSSAEHARWWQCFLCRFAWQLQKKNGVHGFTSTHTRTRNTVRWRSSAGSELGGKRKTYSSASSCEVSKRPVIGM